MGGEWDRQIFLPLQGEANFAHCCPAALLRALPHGVEGSRE